MKTRSAQAATWILVGGSTIWAALTLVAPFAATRELSAAAWIYAFFDVICHQRAERSFHLFGEPLAVCHRCLGLYLGFPLGVLILPRLSWLRDRLAAAPRLLLLFFAPMAVDVALGVLWNANVWASRFSTGLFAALPVGLLAWLAVAELLGPRSATPIRASLSPTR